MQREPSATPPAVDLAATLTGLAVLDRSSADRFTQAAGEVEEPLYGEILERYAGQYRQFAQELDALIRRHGGEPLTTNQPTGGLQRTITELLTGAISDASLIAQCDSQAERAVQEYYDALQQTLPADVEALVREQFGEIKGVHTHIHRLHEALNQTQGEVDLL
jgi:uncharacterized protein (TIGR02284 family)